MIQIILIYSDRQKRLLFSWGAGNQGQLGIGTEILSISTPTLVQTLLDEDLIQITATGDVSAAVTASGQVYTWGRTKVPTSIN